MYYVITIKCKVPMRETETMTNLYAIRANNKMTMREFALQLGAYLGRTGFVGFEYVSSKTIPQKLITIDTYICTMTENNCLKNNGCNLWPIA